MLYNNIVILIIFLTFLLKYFYLNITLKFLKFKFITKILLFKFKIIFNVKKNLLKNFIILLFILIN